LNQQLIENQISIPFSSGIIDEMLNINEIPIDLDLNNITLSTAWTFAKYRLDANQAKIFRFLISQIQPEDENFKTYFFSIKELCKVLNLNEKNAYSEIPKCTAKMLSTFVEFRSDSSDLSKDGKLIQIALLSVAEYENGTLKIKFNPVLKPVLIKLKDELSFSYRLNEVLFFSCSYTFRWFDILKAMQKEGITSRTFLISEIRNIFKINDNEYVRHFDFRKRIIDPSQMELKEYSNIYFEYEEERVGKRVEKIKIELKTK
jgi:plasmid replication initiation protein